MNLHHSTLPQTTSHRDVWHIYGPIETRRFGDANVSKPMIICTYTGRAMDSRLMSHRAQSHLVVYPLVPPYQLVNFPSEAEQLEYKNALSMHVHNTTPNKVTIDKSYGRS